VIFEGVKIKEGLGKIILNLVYPILVVLVGILINNYYQAKKQPNLIASTNPHQVIKLSDNNFKVKCTFIIRNQGGSSTKKKKVTFIIPESVKIDEIEISNKYKSFYKAIDGGVGNSYVVYEIDLPKGKTIDGGIIFYSNVNIPEDGVCPLNIYY